MAVKKQEFTVESFKQMVLQMLHYALIGKPIQYEVKANDVMFIRRTKDLLMLVMAEFSFAETLRSIEITLYTESGGVEDKYIYIFNEPIEKKN